VLVVGALGAIVFALSFVLLVLMTDGARDASVSEGLSLLQGGLALVGAVALARVMFGLRVLLGRAQIVAAALALLAGLGGALAPVLPRLLGDGSARAAGAAALVASVGSTLLFGVVAAVANQHAMTDGQRRVPAIVVSGWLYGLGAIASGVLLKLATKETIATWAPLIVASNLLVAAGAMSHALGLLVLARPDREAVASGQAQAG